jgi:hypothetical protein
MIRDRLFLLKPDFADPAYPGQRFYCWHCALLEGVLASFPHLQAKIDVVRIAWPRPRQPGATPSRRRDERAPGVATL